MKLWVWDDNVLCDYTCGGAFVYAETEDRAWELLKAASDTAWYTFRGYPREQEGEEWGSDMHHRPRLVETESAFVVWGSS